MTADGFRFTPNDTPVVEIDMDFSTGLSVFQDQDADVIDLAEYRRRLDLRYGEVKFQ